MLMFAGYLAGLTLLCAGLIVFGVVGLIVVFLCLLLFGLLVWNLGFYLDLRLF